MASAWLRTQIREQWVSILVTGMGIREFPGHLSVPYCEWMVNAGICGALGPEYQIGDIVEPAVIRLRDEADEVILPGGQGGSLVTVHTPVFSPGEKESIPGDFVDMECFYQAEWAKKNDIPFYCLKIISDVPGTESTFSAHLSSLGKVLPVLTKSVEHFVKNLVGNSKR